MQDDPTITAYDKYARVYDEEVIEFWDNFPPEFIARFVAGLPGRRILNLGSGSGRDAILLRDQGLDVICVDASKSMIDITNDLGFESHLATFAELNFPIESFDSVWAYTSLIHISKSDAKAVIDNVRTLLKQNGVFAIGAIEGKTAGMVERKTMPDSARFFKKYSKDELRHLVEACGFTFIYEQDYRPHNSVYLNHLYKKSA